MGTMTDYDAIIIGGGHNGLVAAAYLAQAGQSVLVLERRDMVGGACVTEELFPGYRVSSCAYICHLLQAKVIDDLRLREHGFAVYQLEPARFQPYPDGNVLVFWDDVDRTAAGDAPPVGTRCRGLSAVARLLAPRRRPHPPLFPHRATVALRVAGAGTADRRRGRVGDAADPQHGGPRKRLFRVPLAPGGHDPGPRRWRSGRGGQRVLPKLHPLRRVLPAGGLRDSARRAWARSRRPCCGPPSSRGLPSEPACPSAGCWWRMRWLRVAWSWRMVR